MAQNTKNFQPFGRKKITLDSELALCYLDQKEYCITCIKNSYDITDLEAQRFLEATEVMIKDFINGNRLERKKGSVVIQDYMGSSDTSRSGSLAE